MDASSSSGNVDQGPYPYPSHVNPASFMSVKLSAERLHNYDEWRVQMECLLDSHDLLGFVDGTVKEPQEDDNSKGNVADFKAKHREWQRSDLLVKGWIFGSVSEDVMRSIDSYLTAKDIWDFLMTDYGMPVDRLTAYEAIRACKEYIGLTHVTGCRNPFKGIDAHRLLASTIKAEYYDFAYDLLKDCYHELDTVDPVSLWRLVYNLAEKPDAFRSAKQYNCYQRYVYSRVSVENCSLSNTPKNPDIENQVKCRTNLVGWKSYVCRVMERICAKFWEFAVLHVPHIKSIHEEKMKHNKVLTILKFCCEKNGKIRNIRDGFEDALILAVKNDIPEVIEQITRFFPLSIRNTRDDRCTLYQLAIMNRCENAYNFLVYEKTYHKDLHHHENHFFEDEDKNLLYVAAKLVPDDKLNKVTGAALQMQRELQWFKEISKIVPPRQMKSRNRENDTPMMVFKKEHRDLRQKGEDWMKQTAGSYIITAAALIIIMVFPAIITVPGGNNGETGRAIYKDKLSFMIYCYSVWISFFTSNTSLLLFLSLLTERYADEDFLKRLPKRLIFGLVTLFMSVTTMVIAYSAAFYIMSVFEHEELVSWHLVLICLMTSLPIASFVTLQLPLLVDLISSTYGRGIFGNQRELRKTT
ncbi:putative P-type ATPase, transmembrane domain superfamily, PGG domain, retrotransposon Copia [Helianthus annuus]|nr:putative P-type ATPase, transmembrane domain superfamily, PGG domain, retrotransposon Copia [Helianthus annuus]